MTVLPPDDDDPAPEWESDRDTVHDLAPEDLQEVAPARPPATITPPRGVETLPGYDLGRRDERMAFFRQWGPLMEQVDQRGAARVLQKLRDELTRQKNTPEFVDEFVRRMAALAGVKLG